MYVPPHFAEADPAALREVMQRFPLATLVSTGPQGMRASHVPVLYDSEPAPLGTLLCHVARTNPQWRDLDGNSEGLAVFSGPDAYVSPSWYESAATVPTWNYVAVHAHGRLRAFDDPQRLRDLVARLTARFETGRPQPWSIDDAPPDYIGRMLRAIVGIEMPVARIFGAWKLSQNRSEVDRHNVERVLLASEAPRDRETGEEMTRLRRPS